MFVKTILLAVAFVSVGLAGFADVSLDGYWEFRFEEGKPIEKVSLTNFAATGTMRVPGCFDAGGELRFRRGTGLYRRTFTLEKPVENAWLLIDGMGLRGLFEIDGKSLGVYPYPYAKLELETGPLAAGEHTLFAALDNRLDWTTMKLARTFYDFYFFGGFYRSVRLEFGDRQLLVRTRDRTTGEIEVQIACRNDWDDLGWGNGQDYTKEGPVEELRDEDFIARQLDETRGMVRASFNHPSVVIDDPSAQLRRQVGTHLRLFDGRPLRFRTPSQGLRRDRPPLLLAALIEDACTREFKEKRARR